MSITANSASVHTTGSYAPAIFAQSVGGGGGLINYQHQWWRWMFRRGVLPGVPEPAAR